MFNKVNKFHIYRFNSIMILHTLSSLLFMLLPSLLFPFLFFLLIFSLILINHGLTWELIKNILFKVFVNSKIILFFFLIWLVFSPMNAQCLCYHLLKDFLILNDFCMFIKIYLCGLILDSMLFLLMCFWGIPAYLSHNVIQSKLL